MLLTMFPGTGSRPLAAVGMAKSPFASWLAAPSPHERDQAEARARRVLLVPGKLPTEELLLEQEADHEHRDRQDREDRGGIRSEPQRHPDHKWNHRRIHRMTHDAVGAGVDHVLVPFRLMS